jgi:predicted transposase/invertase (TIGR01784 family)
MPRYINPYTDFGFKKLFGEEANKDLLIDFLNALLPEKHQIKTLKFRNVEQRGDITIHRKAVFDIFCEAQNGEQFIVEMQHAPQDWFKDRALFLSTFPIREQAVPGENWNFELKTVYLVAVLGFEYDKNEERRKLRRDVTLKDQDGDEFYDKLQFIFLQLPLFKKTESELVTREDKWHYFLKNLVRFEDIPSIFREPVFEQAFATAEVARMSKDELFEYEMSLMAYRDNRNVLDTARAEGEARGKAEGKAEGEANKAIEIARNMKNDGAPPAMISKYTGLSLDEINRLK